MSTQTARAADSGSRSKDIFISYSRRDKPWVDDYLKRLLTAAEVGYAIDEEDFPIGGLLDESIRKAVKECRYTLLVMTPDWVRGKWTHYESLLAVEQDPNAEDHHILAIKLKDCEVPPHIAPRLYLDLCEARRRDKAIVKLLQQIGVSEDGIAKAQNSVAKKTLLLLIELLEEPQVAQKVSKLEEMFRQVQRSNEILTSNKQLHDDLQDIQLTISQIPLQAPALHAEQGDWKRVRAGMSALCLQVEKLLNHAAAITDNLIDVTFVDSFKGLPDDLDQAFQARDARRFLSHLTQLSWQVERSLPRINDRIVQHLKDRRMEDLVQSLQTVYEMIADVDFDEATSALLRAFRAGIDTRQELDRSIRERVDDHCTLQDAEMEFRQMIGHGEPTFYDISTHWSRVQSWVRKLKLADRYEKLLAAFDQLCQQLSDDRSVRDDRFEEAVKWNFEGFVHETRKEFNRLDIDLLALCNRLKPHGEELQQILNRMHHYDAQS